MLFQNWLAILTRHRKERECDRKLRGQRRYSLACCMSTCRGSNTSSAATTSIICISTFDQLSPCKLQLYILTAINTSVVEYPFLIIVCHLSFSSSFALDFVLSVLHHYHQEPNIASVCLELKVCSGFSAQWCTKINSHS